MSCCAHIKVYSPVHRSGGSVSQAGLYPCRARQATYAPQTCYDGLGDLLNVRQPCWKLISTGYDAGWVFVACRGDARVRVADARGCCFQVLEAMLPVALAAVDCNGTEASLLDCESNNARIGRCFNSTDGTVLACGTTAPGAAP